MVRMYRPKRLQYSRGQLLQAIEAVKKRNIKVAVAAKKYQVPLTTLRCKPEIAPSAKIRLRLENTLESSS